MPLRPFSAIAGCFLVLAQSPDPLVKTTVPLLQISAAVTDRYGKPIEGLSAADFLLRDENIQKPVTLDTIDDGLPPVALLVLVQTNDRSRYVLGKVKKMGSVIADALGGASSQVAVIAYHHDVNVLQDFTSSGELISAAFQSLHPSDDNESRLLDAIGVGIGLLSKRTRPARVHLLIVGERRDRGSLAKLSEIDQRLQSIGAVTYGLSYSSYLTAFTVRPDEYQPDNGSYIDGLKDLARLGKADVFQILAQDTGGSAGAFETKAGLESALLRLSRDLHSRYLLSFYPEKEADSHFRRIALTIRGHPEAMVHAREGYWSAP